MKETPMTEQNPYSFSAFMAMLQNNFALFVVGVLFFMAGFFIGSIWTERGMLKSGDKAGTAPTAPSAAAPAAPTGPTAEDLNKIPKVESNEHIKGSSNAQITLVEYSDFECPFCARFHPTTQQILKDYGSKVRLVYRNYPLPFHPNAQKAAEAGECVAKVGGNDAFWKYADAIFAKQDELGGKLSPEGITQAVTAAGVNATTVKTCMDSGEMAAKIQAQMDGASAAGINGTPGTVIVTKDGAQELIGGALPYEQVKPMLDKYIK